ncbi:outer membrane protein assembly factor BamB family protein [Candidatus Uabimicrobium amorphum]|uniref:Protein kinase n=1 Tax=Uabimicrobium amorphum TaxID=2596890 RepID=A0A5S9IL20_UABAM|nr:PQQ-binding-like beta-propeller repeat protein [Candidatus Uabimicrobium amorphum]BBM83839.1 protein kinase [Candidatus Uabimicrobium amorphum]
MSENNESLQAKLLGELGSIGLAEVFETLGTKNRYGWLTLKNQNEEIVLYFQGDLVGLVTLPEEKLSYIPEKLYYSNRISVEQYQAIIESEDPLGTLEELVDSDTILNFLNTIYYDEICYLFSWTEGYFEFVDQKPGDEASPIGKLFEAETILLDAARRLDENKEIDYVITDKHEILIHAVEQGIPEEMAALDEPLGNVWHLANYKNFQEVIAFSYLSEFDSAKILATLYQENSLRFLTDDELQHYASELEQQDNVMEAEKCYRLLLRRNPYNNEACEALIHINEAAGNIEVLEELYEQIASNFISSDDPNFQVQGAFYLKRYSDLKKDAPEGIEARLHLLDMVVNSNIDPEMIGYAPVQDGRVLFQYFRTQRKDQKAKQVLQNLTKLAPDDVSLRSELINVYLDLNEKDAALEQYEHVMYLQEISGNVAELRATYQRVLRLDPRRKDIQQKFDRLSAKQSGQKSAVGKFLIAVLILGILAGGVYYINDFLQQKQQSKRQFTMQVEQLIAKDMLRNVKQMVLDSKILDQLEKDSFLRKIQNKEEMLLKKIDRDFENAIVAKQGGDLLKSQEILAGILKINVAIEPDSLKGMKDLQREVKVSLANFDRDLKLAQQYEVEKKYSAAIKLYLKIWSMPDYQRHPKRNTIKLPIKLLNFDAKKADVWVDSEKTKVRNNVLRLPPNFQKLKLETDGYAPYLFYNAFENNSNDVEESNEGKVYPLKKPEIRIVFKKETLWSYDVNGIVEAAPCFGDDKLYIAARDDNIYTIQSLDSIPTESWQPFKPNPLTSFSSSPIFHNGILYLAGNNYKLYAVKGKYLYARYTLPSNALISAPVVLSKDKKLVFFTTENGAIYAMPTLKNRTRNWKPRWKKSLRPARKLFAAVDGNEIFVHAKNSHLYCFNATNGKTKWRTAVEQSSDSVPSIYRTRVYLGGSNLLYFIDRNNGKILNKKRVKGRIAGKPAVNSRGIFFGTSAFHIYGISHRGKPLWRQIRARDEFEHSAVLNQDGVLYIACKNGVIYAIDSKTGKEVWKYSIEKVKKIEQKVTSPIVLVKDKLFVGSYKTIYAFSNN